MIYQIPSYSGRKSVMITGKHLWQFQFAKTNDLVIESIVEIILWCIIHKRGGVMVSSHDVAAYILKTLGSMTAMKLQKLVYYCQAWSLVWDEKPLFPEKIEAWSNGPVVRELYDRHRGKFIVDSWRGNSGVLTSKQKQTINAVLHFYGKKTSQWLSDLTHQERPWVEARKGLPPEARGSAEITLAAMAEYYGSLQ